MLINFLEPTCLSLSLFLLSPTTSGPSRTALLLLVKILLLLAELENSYKLLVDDISLV